MLFLMGFATGALLAAVAYRRAEAIRLRIERHLGDRAPGSWEAWRNGHPVRLDRREWWREPR